MEREVGKREEGEMGNEEREEGENCNRDRGAEVASTSRVNCQYRIYTHIAFLLGLLLCFVHICLEPLHRCLQAPGHTQALLG